MENNKGNHCEGLADRLVAHRGYAARYPENSLLAVERAVAKGARFVEVDLQLTADLQPVLYHDRDMNRLSGSENRIQLLTFDELERYSLHNPVAFGDRFEDEPIAHLQNLVNLMLFHPQVTFFLEFKRVSLETFGNELFLQKVLPLLELVKEQVVLISYSPELIQRALEMEWRAGLVRDLLPEAGWCEQFCRNPEFLFLNHECLSNIDLNQKKSEWPGVQIAVFEVTEVEYARQLFNRGVDLIETFAIAMMRKGLAGASLTADQEITQSPETDDLQSFSATAQSALTVQD